MNQLTLDKFEEAYERVQEVVCRPISSRATFFHRQPAIKSI